MTKQNGIWTRQGWCNVPSIKWSDRHGCWKVLVRTPGASTARSHLTDDYGTALTIYLSRTFDKQTLIEAAAHAEDREQFRNRVRSVAYRNRKHKKETIIDGSEEVTTCQ